MILAYHLVISTYGFWMPNEECGSWSSFVRAYELWRAGGNATKVATRRSVAGRPRDPQRRDRIRAMMVREPVVMTGEQAQAAAAGFGDYCQRTGCMVHACALLPDHVHLVVERHRVRIERVCEQFKAAATTAFNQRGIHPFADEPYRNGRLPTPWARKGWWVYLDSHDDIVRSVDYTAANPGKSGLRRQQWSFVTPYNHGTLRVTR